MQLRVSLGFARLPDPELDNFGQSVVDQMTANAAAFPAPPLTLASVQANKDDFTDKIAKAAIGGPPDTANKNNSRVALLSSLRQLGGYVQIQANSDMATLLSSGFQAMSTNRARVPLEQPTGLKIKNGGTGQLIASIHPPVKNTSMYEGRIKGPTGDWMTPTVLTGDSQHIVFNGLTPGLVYTIQVRALGGLTGQSDWSDPSTHMAM